FELSIDLSFVSKVQVVVLLRAFKFIFGSDMETAGEVAMSWWLGSDSLISLGPKLSRTLHSKSWHHMILIGTTSELNKNMVDFDSKGSLGRNQMLALSESPTYFPNQSCYKGIAQFASKKENKVFQAKLNQLKI
ncbi:hypothetical protein M8C21_023789, partial [Ambrosia artemisiifolia]